MPRKVSEDHNRGSNASSHTSLTNIHPSQESESEKNKFNGDLISELVVHESKDQGPLSLSQLRSTQNYISLTDSSSYCLQGRLNTQQRKLVNNRGYTETNHEGPCAVKTILCTESNTQPFIFGASTRHAHVQLQSGADRQTHPSYSSPSVTTNTNWTPLVSHTDTQVTPSKSSPCQKSDLDVRPTQGHKSPGHSVSARASFNEEEELRGYNGLEHAPILPSSTSSPHHQSREANAIKSGVHEPCPQDSSLAHSHPADADLLLPPSPQCSKSAALQQRLEAVEASLAANKDRITTLLNIIRDLETSSTPTSSRRCRKAGQDLKNCSTCQKTACIVYSIF
ncbi:uncharacterized protein LOC133460325 isoform X2 [Cololabis saira]|uniref:uncharacterized protein LOC133460325 isoform X2 n=1 Tax=Cololabis saira TaxID=129043 RepID=UPI002AD2B699|nr:uncharacterized protein LOC133460325 isoform X2 [Cololabis saira]